jgi:hypothetical protein
MKLVFSPCYSEESPILKLNPNKEKCLEMIDELLKDSNNEQGLVYVVFFRFQDENEIPKTIFTSSINEYIIEFIENNLDCTNWKDLTLYIYEFTSYNNAFNWCVEFQKDN